jgi:serine/threonine protein phosphatase 1
MGSSKDVGVSDWIDAPTLRPAGKEFVVGDIHGQAEKMETILRNMGEAAAREGGGHLTLLGDLIDKGPDQIGALKIATYPPESFGFSGKTLVIGNHDLFLLLELSLDNDNEHVPRFNLIRFSCLWQSNGGGEFLEQLGLDRHGAVRSRLIERIGLREVNELEQMVGSRKSGNLRLTHAGPGWYYQVPADEWFAARPLFTGFIDGSEQHYTWTRFWWTRSAVDNEIVVHGHTPERMFDGGPWQPDIHRIDGQRLGLDGGAENDLDRKIVGAEIEEGRYRIYWVD